ncbi:MAG: hypothetical protein KatS3mg077_1480 [Candidatus Binatia bacterium]|nr:MAG: hypothetical protein KatS3mg077_1480 [Candidatus Binatia bacterium]
MSSSVPDRSRFVLPADHPLLRVRPIALGVGALGFAVSLAGALVNATQFFQSYLFGFLFWFGIAIGSLALLMIYHVTGGAWGSVIRRSLESAVRTLPVLAVLFIPIVLGVHSLYEWADADKVAHDPLLQHKSLYLNVPFFVGRAVAYFVVWSVFATFLWRWSDAQENGEERAIGWLENLSRGGLVALGLTFTFAAVDWAMSLEPHWYSTLYGVLLFGGCLLSAMAFMIQITALLANNGPLAGVVQPMQFHDLGKLMFAFVMLWAYFSFSQLLIIWSGNLPEETPWYLKRMSGGWQYVGLCLIVLNFLLPFVILLSRDIKRNARLVASVALFILCVRVIEVYWLITPAFSPSQARVHWLDLTTWLAVGGVWLWAFTGGLRGRPLMVWNDPSFPAAGGHA